MTTNSLTIFTKAALMLAEADTIQKTKELKDLALTAGEWAKRKGMGEAAIQHCRSYALEAERKMGEMLAQTERAKPGPGKKDRSQGFTEPPTLAELGITKNESSKAQKLAALPKDAFDEVRDGKKRFNEVRREIKRTSDKAALVVAKRAITTAGRKSLSLVCDLRICSCASLFASGIKPDAVITDPPYPEKFLPAFTELAQSCKAANVPLVAVMSGQSYLPEVLRRLCEHLAYRWTLAYLTPGGQAVQQWKAKINAAWKPILLFGMAREWLGDVATSKPNDNDKRFHDWGQSESGMTDLVKRLTKPGQLVCDPFLGGGTTAVTCLALGRRFVGCDIDAACVKKTLGRAEALWQK